MDRVQWWCSALCGLLLGCSGGTSADHDAVEVTDAASMSDVTMCTSDRECSASNRVCDRAQGVCVDCVATTDCLNASEVCIGNRCVSVTPCTSSRMCPGQVCNTTLGYCVDCVADVDCTNGQVCRNSACAAPPRPCMSSRQCSDIGQVCDTVGGHCVQCVGDVDCDPGLRCNADHTCGPRPPQSSCTDATTPGCGVVVVSGGNFSLGEVGAQNAEPIQPDITTGNFQMDAYEVTVARFRKFWLAGHPALTSAVTYPSGSVSWAGIVAEPQQAASCNWSPMPGAREAHPINCVEWGTALAFCAWDGGRLPTEAEWEWAARGRPIAGLSAPRRYPWGDQEPTGSATVACDRAQWNLCVGDDGAVTRRVGSFAPSGGIYDLAGNIYEWAADVYALYSDTGCWGGSPRTNPVCRPVAGGDLLLRGGSWRADMTTYLHGASRGHTTAGYSNIGFRCVATR